MKIFKALKRALVGGLTACMALAVGAGAASALKTADARAEGTSEAYFVTEDRYTQGFWYNGENGLKDNPELDRNYGEDGLVLFLHWLRQNGQQSLDAEFLNDFTDDSGYYPDGTKASYVEYPSYVTSVEGNISSISDDTYTYCMNTPFALSRALKESQNGIEPLPIEGPYHDGEEFTWSHGGFETAVGSTTEFTVEVSDEEWHRVTYYVGCPWRHKYFGYDAQWIKVFDPDGNLLAQHLVDDVNQGVYVQFAVKGSFIIQFAGNALSAFSNGLFFDPYTENAEIGTSDFSVALEGSKTLNLSWTNKSEETYTSVFRRVKGEKYWDFVAETEPGVSEFRDETALVSTTYEYALASATEKRMAPTYTYENVKANFLQPEIRVKSYNLPDFAGMFEVSTAPYNKTAMEFLDSGYGAGRNEEFTARVRLTRTDDDVTYTEYAGVEVTFMLSGENVSSDLGVNVYPNMNAQFGKAVTDENGVAEVTGSVPYAGEYTLTASIEPQPDPENDMYGYDSSFAETVIAIEEKGDENPSVPVLMSISDAIQPGNTVTMFGYNLGDDGQLAVACAENEGKEPGAFDDTRRFFYIEDEDLLFVDSANGTGIMFVFPEYMDPGIYDFYVHNANGWSNGITMNAARPLYLDQEGAYEGQEIQIVGRNFLQNEYGVGDLESALNALKVRLTQISDAEGNPVNGMSYTLTAKNGGILTGSKVSKEEALQFESDVLQAEDIPYTYSLRITIKVPAVYSYGTYEVTVASDGKDFRALTDNCKLQIVEKKAQNWDKTVFGEYTDAHWGNDPLDLGVYWAQDLNYTNVKTMAPNTFETAAAYTTELNATIAALSKEGGGVVYFPEGTYYLSNNVTMASGVMLVGAGADKTTLVYANNTQVNTIWFATADAINTGIARLSLNATDERLHTELGWYAPKYVVKWDGDGRYDEDTTLTTIKNRFLIGIEGNLYGGETVQFDQCQRLVSVTGKNCVMKDSVFVGSMVSTELNSYGTMWNVKWDFLGAVEMSPHWMGRYVFMENCYFDMRDMGHGPSVKSDQYIAYTFTAHAGNRAEPTNDGEALLMEAPSGTFSTGRVLTSTKRTITLDFTGGSKMFADTAIRYNMCAVYISDGTGQGQYRYIKIAGTGDYTNCYELMDWEKDWDILPDHTSVFSCMAPLANMTIYHYKAYDCVSSICIYSNHMDTVVDGCTLVDTAGITGGGLASGGMSGGRINPMTNVRIVNNDISGIAPFADMGAPAASVAQSGGIQIYSGGSGDYMGLLTAGITIRNNRLHDMLPSVPYTVDNVVGTGIVLYFRGGQNNSANGMRYIVVEDNVVENSDWGIKVERYMTGVVVRNNQVSGTALLDTDVTVDRPIGYYGGAMHELYVNGERSELSGEYEFESLLPEAPAEDGKVFYGWTKDENFTADSETVTHAFGNNVTLYAVFGYEVTFDYNYLLADGTEKGTFASFKVLEGDSLSDQVNGYGNPFRVGYTFGGWYTDKECTAAFDPEDPVAENGKVYAKWIADAGTDTDSSTGSDSGNPGGGCGSALGVGMAAIGLLAAASALAVHRKRGE